MPATSTYYYSRQKLVPFLGRGQEPQRLNVQFAANQTLAQGTVVGELTATPGTYGAYASGHSDGTQVAKGILEYAVTTDGSGNITNIGDLGYVQTSAPIFIGNQGATYKTSDLVGLDAGALTALGGALVQGTISSGVVVI